MDRFKDDGTFATGILAETSYSGKWSYDHPKTQLTLVPDPADEKNSQWKVMFNEDMLVWVGTSRYADNSTQIRLVRRPNYPGEEKD